jgi:hypothetical protein
MTATISGQLIDLASGGAWLHELRGPDGKWVHSPADEVGKGIDRYKVPPHARLVNPRADIPDPADYPFFRKHPVSAKNIIEAYDAVPKELRAPGKSWYPDAHLLAKALAGGDAEKGAILLANYSPQANWPINMFRAARAFADSKPIPAGEGFVSGDQVRKAQRALDGARLDEVLVSPKIRSFAHLIAQGDDSPDDPYGHVVIDAHALNVAAGGDIRGATYGHDRQKLAPEDDPPIGRDVRAHEYVGDQYRQAAHEISVRDGKLMKPYELQAITWVAQVMSNQAVDRAQMETAAGAKGRLSARAKDWQRWLAWAKEHHIPLQPGVSALSGSVFAQVIELLSDTIEGQFELAFNPLQPRDSRGRWARGGGGTITRQIHPPITEAEARGNSRPVSAEEFQRLAGQGLSRLALLNTRTGHAGLTQHWDEIKAKTWPKVQESWGGATIDAVTGQPLEDGADRYALTVKPQGMEYVSVPETASQAQFDAAMDEALRRFGSELDKSSRYLGVFHDDDSHRIDIDPTLVVDSIDDVETIGAYTRAIGGAYHFASGDGFWPPHVSKAVTMADDDDTVHFDGPGQWLSAARRAQPGLDEKQQAEIERAAAQLHDTLTGQLLHET